MTSPSFDADTIVIGSGFGGAVAACRLAAHGQRVLVLERGRRWTPATYPRTPDDAWLWDQDEPHRQNGWADLRLFGDMSVVAAAGVGGGSLIYANVSVEAKPEAFATGWPREITYAELKPHYDTVARMLSVRDLPQAQFNPRTRLMRRAAEASGWGDRFRTVPLAVKFDDDWHWNLPDPHDDKHSVYKENAFGKEQGTCVHCGNCDIGCQVSAKNTLDLNYLALAERHGAQIRPLHLVEYLEPLPGGGWRVHVDDLSDGSRQRRTLSAARVILAAGSIGSTEVLLRSRDQYGTLPGLSDKLGKDWAFNGDFVSLAFYPDDPQNPDDEISPSRGVTISSAIDLLDGLHEGSALFIEDGGIPNLARGYIQRRLQRWRLFGSRLFGRRAKFWRDLARMANRSDPLQSMMPWFGQAVDPGDGVLYLGRPWYAPWRRQLKMRWDYRRSERVVEAMISAHRKLSENSGALRLFVPPTWTAFHNLITPHPLGGCRMGETAANGVTDARGRVFGYDGLFVMDGAVVPRAIGLNPSRTIAALAERNTALLIAELGQP